MATTIIPNDINNLNGAITSLGSDDIANDSTNVSGSKVTNALDTLNGATTNIQGQISSYVETGNTASRAYTKGQYVVWKGVLYIVTANISSGGAFTSGTNVTTAPVTSELTRAFTVEEVTLSASNMTLPTGVTLYQENRILRCGKICFLNFSIKLENITSTSAKTITGYFPIGWRPNGTFYIAAETGLGDGKLQAGNIEFSNSSFRIFPVNTGTTYCIGTLTYVCE